VIDFYNAFFKSVSGINAQSCLFCQGITVTQNAYIHLLQFLFGRWT